MYRNATKIEKPEFQNFEKSVSFVISVFPFVRPSVCPSIGNNCIPNGRFLIFRKCVERIQVSLYCYKDKGYVT